MNSPPPAEPPELASRRPRRWWSQWRVHLAKHHRLLWAAAWVTATVCLIPTVRRLDLVALRAQLAHARLGWMLLGVAMNFALLPLMTAQWRLLLPSARRAPWRRLWSCVTLSMASMNTLPFGGGHAVAVGLIATRGISTVSGGASLLALEQVCEALAKLALLVFVLWAARLPAPLWRAGWLSLAVVAVAVAMVVLMRRKRSRSGTPAWWHSWTQHWETLRRPRPFGVACGLSVAMKLAALIAIDAVQRSLGVNLPWASTALVLAAVTFATMMSVAPGNVGLYELAAIAAYRFLGVPDRLAASLAVLVHLAFLIPIVGTGYGALAAKVWRTRRHAGAAPP